MSKLRFWVAFTTAIVFALSGYFLASIIPLPPPYSLNQSKFLYSILGVLAAIGIFARLTQWILRTSTDLTRQLIIRISTEVSSQVINLANTGLHLNLRDREIEPKIHNPVILDT